ncbi:hypothetical protein HDU91_006072 [Kappamyces sp. JEL0680]|nr:hypothetical protein HDU91_006072 [Kappamyces sp. JEL0680]
MNSAPTENNAAAFASTLDPRLDLFFKLVRDVCPVPEVEGQTRSKNASGGSTKLALSATNPDNSALIALIENSWSLEPLHTLKILFNWRDCRGGKGDRHGFIVAMSHIERNHRSWFRENAALIPEFGRHLDLIHLWYLAGDKPFIMDIIAAQLLADVGKLSEEDKNDISLLAKWIPSENAKWDRFLKGHPRFSISMAQKLFGVDHVTRDHLKKLRQEYVSPLRKHIKLVETQLCEKDYGSINYQAVPSVAMKRYRKVFFAKDSERFKTFLSKVASGEQKINASQVYPHDIVRYYLANEPLDQTLELQWKAIKTKVDELGAFKNAIAVVDVSGSMHGTPMEVAIALGLLSLNPSNDHKMITFDSLPSLHSINHTDSLMAQVSATAAMPWGASTNIEKVFQLILGSASLANLDKIFIFSDMQFNAAIQGRNPAAHFHLAKRKFEAAGRTFPSVVFWNLRASTNNFPVTQDECGATMLAGFSPSLLNTIIDGKEVTPMCVLMNIINDPRYDCIKAPIVDTR